MGGSCPPHTTPDASITVSGGVAVKDSDPPGQPRYYEVCIPGSGTYIPRFIYVRFAAKIFFRHLSCSLVMGQRVGGRGYLEDIFVHSQYLEVFYS